MRIGRNDPCPCGSGKKYKHCCLLAQAAQPEAPEDLTWRHMRRLLDEHNSDMLRFTTNVYGHDAFAEAWREFALDEETEFDPENLHMQVFLPWLYHFWSPDPAKTQVRDAALHERVPTAEYLRRKRSLHPLLREYLGSCLEAPLSVLEVTASDPGRGLRLRDLLTGQAHQVAERSASQTMREGDLIFGQVARAGGLGFLETCQAFVIPPSYKIEILEFRRRHFPERSAPPASVRALDIEVLALYNGMAARLLEPKLPALRNTDGETLSPRRVVFDVASAEEAFGALKHLALGASDDELLSEAVRDSQGRLERVKFSWLKQGNPVNPGWENTVMGTIEIRGTRLAVEVNSEERERKLRGLVAEALGERARYRATKVQSMKTLLGRSSPEESARAREESARLAELPEVKAKIAEMMEKHFAGWVNMKIPALGGRTPLEALGDPDGREAVEALVREAERNGARMQPPLDPGIIRRLRERLGLLPGPA
jgi:hypothetical protein